MHCAVCGGDLEEFRLLDAKRVGYVCVHGHSFFSWCEPFGRRFCVPKKVRPLAAGATDVEILRYWLTNPVAREQLVDLLAMVCERLIELVESSADEPRRLADESLKRMATRGREAELLRFCPTCGKPLSMYHDPDDSWVTPLRCQAGHHFSYRGWRIWFREGGGKFELWLFPADDWLASTVDDALGREHESTWKELVHPQMRTALSHLRRLLA